MRRGLASLILGLSLLVATASWAGFVLSHTVLDPGRSERLADHLLDDPAVRSSIQSRLADALAKQVPANVPVPRQTLEAAAQVALDDPRVETLVRDGIVQAHQNALAGNDDPIMLDATVLGQAGRDALVRAVPTLDRVLPAAPPVSVEVPGTGLSWLGTVKSNVDHWTPIGAAVALAGIVLAFVLARNRPAALRRVAFWAFASSAFWIIMAYAIPSIARSVAPSSAAIASAAVDVFFGAMVRPAVVLAGVGVALLLISFVWPSMARRRPAAMLDRASRNLQPAGGTLAGERRYRASARTPRRPGTGVELEAGWPDGQLDQSWAGGPPGAAFPTQAGPTGPPLAGHPAGAVGRREPTAEYPVIMSSVSPQPGSPQPGSAHPDQWATPSLTAAYPDPAYPDPAHPSAQSYPTASDAPTATSLPVVPPATAGPPALAQDGPWVEGVGYVDSPGRGRPFDPSGRYDADPADSFDLTGPQPTSARSADPASPYDPADLDDDSPTVSHPLNRPISDRGADR